MNFKKFIIIIITTLIILPDFCFADDYIENNNTIPYIEVASSTNLNKAPNINARHAVILDRASKTILFGKNENETCKMASTTKIMTAIVVIENCTNLNEIVTVSKHAARNWRFKAWFIHK